MGVSGLYVPGAKQPPGPQNDTEYSWPAGAIARPQRSVQSVYFQNPASGCVAEGMAASSARLSGGSHAMRAAATAKMIKLRRIRIEVPNERKLRGYPVRWRSHAHGESPQAPG